MPLFGTEVAERPQRPPNWEQKLRREFTEEGICTETRYFFVTDEQDDKDQPPSNPHFGTR